jgi:hypothetical protein
VEPKPNPLKIKQAFSGGELNRYTEASQAPYLNLKQPMRLPPRQSASGGLKNP